MSNSNRCGQEPQSTGKMTGITRRSLLQGMGALAMLPMAASGSRSSNADERNIGTRAELFVDGWLIDRMRGAELRLNPPERREVVLTTDRPWEGVDSAYYSAIQDGGKIRIYYRGLCPQDLSANQLTCMVESADEVRFTRPSLGLFSFDGSRDNNIIWRGRESHNFAPFLDSNPAVRGSERYKALGGVDGKLFGFVSQDGIQWRKIVDRPLITDGTFDSLNTAFWDPQISRYRCYSRFFDGEVRAIQSCTSADFITWSKPVPNRYPSGAPREHFYTNAVRPCPGAEHILLSFPKRFVPSRTKLRGYKEPGVSDAVFMSSRDGLRWDRSFVEAWARPGLDERNWTQRSNMPATGIVGREGEPHCMYVSEHYQWPDNRLRRLSIPWHRFASIHAGANNGEVVTHPLVFDGAVLRLNYATSAAGSVVVELQQPDGAPIPGFGAGDMAPLFGDSLNEPVSWKGRAKLAVLRGKPVRMRFILSDADVYAIRTSPA